MKLNQQPIKTDNKSIYDKIFIRKQAILGLTHVRVLDLFAGRNVLWNNIVTEDYFGIDREKYKGKNLVADSHKIFDSLDLRNFTVIDVIFKKRFVKWYGDNLYGYHKRIYKNQKRSKNRI